MPTVPPVATARPVGVAQAGADGGRATDPRVGRRFGFLLALPAQLLVAFIVIFPLIMVVYLSLSDWTPYSGQPWTAAWQFWNDFDNYRAVLTDGRLWGAMGRTGLIIAIAVPLEFAIGFGLALLFMEAVPLKRVVYAVILVPMMIVPSVAGYMFFLLFQGGGPINQFLVAIMGEGLRVNWLADPSFALASVIIADVWQWSSFMFLILYAGMLGVPEDQLRAATLLGANQWQRLCMIVLPRMRTVIIIALVIRTVELFGNKNFDIPYIMTSGGPGIATETIAIYMYKRTFLDLEWSYVATVGVVIVVALSVVAVLGMAAMNRGRMRRT